MPWLSPHASRPSRGRENVRVVIFCARYCQSSGKYAKVVRTPWVAIVGVLAPTDGSSLTMTGPSHDTAANRSSHTARAIIGA